MDASADPAAHEMAPSPVPQAAAPPKEVVPSPKAEPVAPKPEKTKEQPKPTAQPAPTYNVIDGSVTWYTQNNTAVRLWSCSRFRLR